MTIIMKTKRFRGILAAVLAIALAGVLAWPAVMSAQLRQSGQPGYYYFFQVQNEYEEPFTTDGFVACSIYSREDNGATRFWTHSAASLANSTAQAGPLYSNTNGIIHWYSGTTNPVSVVCYTKGGDAGRKVRMSIRDHKIRIVTSGADKVIRFPFSTNTAPTGSGIYIPEGATVLGVALQIATPGATVAHVDVGFGGNHAFGLRNALADRLQAGPNTMTAAAGFNTYMPPSGAAGATWVNGGIQSVPAVAHYGILLRHLNAGLAAASFYNGGAMVHTTGGLEVTYTTSNVAGLGGHIYVFFRVLHVGSTVHGPGY